MKIEVMRDLVRINSKRKLGTMDKGMLDNVRQIFDQRNGTGQRYFLRSKPAIFWTALSTPAPFAN